MNALPDGWTSRPLRSLVDVLDGQRVPVNRAERAERIGSVPYYGATGQVGCIDRAIFDEKLVLLGEDGVQFFDPHKPKAYAIEGPAWVNNHAHVLRPRESLVDRRYLLHYLNFFDYRGYANGTTRLKLTQAAMNRMPVAAPPMDEQRRIVEILEEHLSHLDAAAGSLDDASCRIRSMESRTMSAVPEFRDAPQVPTRELLAEPLINGRSVPTAENGFPVLRLTALRNGIVDLTERKVGRWSATDAQRFLVEQGDIFVSRGNGSIKLVGSAALVADTPDGVAFPDTMIRLRCARDVIVPEFLTLTWNSPVVRQQIERAARTTAGIYKINQKDLGAVVVPCPTLDVQLKIVVQASESRQVLSRLRLAIESAERRSGALRRSLLAAAFSGRLTGRVRDLDHTEEEIA